MQKISMYCFHRKLKRPVVNTLEKNISIYQNTGTEDASWWTSSKKYSTTPSYLEYSSRESNKTKPLSWEINRKMTIYDIEMFWIEVKG